MARFSHRPKRISRRTERDKFDRLVMPAAFMCLPLGVALLIAAALGYLIYGQANLQMLVLGGAIFAIPGLFQIYRFIRGHFSRQLHEP
ncbi:MAG: hypothetical protein RIQ71_1574 [Verrucomicrobiota bacterium]|jgi:hypothetical protein